MIGEELGHAFLIAGQHPTPKAAPRNDSPASPEHQAWDKAREDDMKDAWSQWPFDRAEHARIREWAMKTRGGLKR